ncbi:MAG: hypothetical protein V1790_10075 [Planctomycetota bacterium]
MSDQPPPDRASSDPSKQAAWDSVSETELDAVLSHAASLAADLSKQLQSNGNPAAPPETAPSTPLEDPQRDLDAELQQLEQLVDAAAAQVQAVDDAAPASPAPAPTESVPDFMSEFTVPPASSDAAADDLSASTSADDLMADLVDHRQERARTAAGPGKSAVVGSRIVGVVGGTVDMPPVAPKPVKPSPAEAEPDPRPSTKPRLAERFGPPILSLLDRFVTLLELIDRPLAHIGSRVRRIVGWIAVAMIAASIVVFVRSIG